jgi:hypothetical protein
MANITYKLCPMTELEKAIYTAQQTIRQSLVGYVGQENVELTARNLGMRLDEHGELHVYYTPVVPLHHINVTVNVRPG